MAFSPASSRFWMMRSVHAENSVGGSPPSDGHRCHVYDSRCFVFVTLRRRPSGRAVCDLAPVDALTHGAAAGGNVPGLSEHYFVQHLPTIISPMFDPVHNYEYHQTVTARHILQAARRNSTDPWAK
jgi:hypothetical protein